MHNRFMVTHPASNARTTTGQRRRYPPWKPVPARQPPKGVEDPHTAPFRVPDAIPTLHSIHRATQPPRPPGCLPSHQHPCPAGKDSMPTRRPRGRHASNGERIITPRNSNLRPATEAPAHFRTTVLPRGAHNGPHACQRAGPPYSNAVRGSRFAVRGSRWPKAEVLYRICISPISQILSNLLL